MRHWNAHARTLISRSVSVTDASDSPFSPFSPFLSAMVLLSFGFWDVYK